VAILAIGWAARGATPTKSHKRQHSSATAASHKPVKKGAKTATAASKSTTSKSTKAKTTKTAANRKGKSARRPSRYYQQAPSPDRYKEIQQALASKGYLQGEPTGEWGPDSVDALKRFQTDQNLTADGKISSLSLIALGLGPKRLTAKSEAAPSQPGVPASSPAPPQ
jgi:peptidoglycan hydrolase-like protein with peptidoglycan-binding domain